jgi:hypothetical protein
MSQAIDVSVCIVSYNTRRILEECIESVRRHTVKSSYEIIVVDNHSNDGTIDFLTAPTCSVRTILNDENVGFAKASNQALALACGRFVLFLNPDTRLLNDAIDRCVSFLGGKMHSDVATCKIVNPQGVVQIPVRDKTFFLIRIQAILHLKLARFFTRSRSLQKALQQGFQVDTIQCADYVTGTFLLARSDFLRGLGMFDERYFLYSEDMDLSLRIRRHGGSLHYYPEAQILHVGGISSKQVHSQAYDQFLLSRYKFYRKNFGLIKALAFRCLVGLGSFIRLVQTGPTRRDDAGRHWRALMWASHLRKARDITT